MKFNKKEIMSFFMKGESAFEIYKKYHTEFAGTEEDWLNGFAQSRHVINSFFNNENSYQVPENSITFVQGLNLGGKLDPFNLYDGGTRLTTEGFTHALIFLPKENEHINPNSEIASEGNYKRGVALILNRSALGLYEIHFNGFQYTSQNAIRITQAEGTSFAVWNM
jgi:hypothetical protein